MHYRALLALLLAALTLTFVPASCRGAAPAVELASPHQVALAGLEHPGPVAAGFNRIALVQLPSSSVGNALELDGSVALAKQYGASMVVFPESSVFGWLNPQVFSSAPPIPGYWSTFFQSEAQKYDIWIAAGLAEQGPPSSHAPSYHHAYDSGILVAPSGALVQHHRKFQVLQNAFSPDTCEAVFGTAGCAYSVGDVNDLATTATPFGLRTTVIVCADAYTYDKTVLDRLRQIGSDFVVVCWGVGAAVAGECNQASANPTAYAAQAAAYLGQSVTVVGANATGVRPYGKFRPAVYCGQSGWARGDGTSRQGNEQAPIVFFDLPAVGAR